MNFNDLKKAVEPTDKYCVWGFLRRLMKQYKTLNMPVIINYYCLLYFWIAERFIKVSKTQLLEILDDGASIKCIESNYYSLRRINRLVACKATINTEILQCVEWHFAIVNSCHGIEFSISPAEQFDQVESVSSYHWKSGDTTFSCGSRYTGPSLNMSQFASGDKYIIILDTKNKTISGKSNDHDPIIIFRNIESNTVKYRLFITLTERNEHVQILQLIRKYY